jgi:hypothetical protein
MNIGEPIREIIVEPTELPISEPACDVPEKKLNNERPSPSSSD